MEVEKIAILGFSEAALTLIFDILESNKNKFEVLIINNLNINPKKAVSSPTLDYSLLVNLPDDFQGKYLLGTINVENKLKIFEHYKIPVDQYINIQHSSVIIANSTTLGKGCILNAGAILAGQSSLANFVYVNRKVSIGHHTQIGDFTTINPGCNIAGNVKIGCRCQIGMGANIIDGVSIGDDTTIGAGSLVLKDIPSNCIAYGNPCKIIREKVSDKV